MPQETPRKLLKYRVTIAYNPPYDKFYKYSPDFGTIEEVKDYIENVLPIQYNFEYHDGEDGRFRLELFDLCLDRNPTTFITPLENILVKNTWS